MKKMAFEWYQYAAPVILTPLSFLLWWNTYEGNIWLTLNAWLIPIIYAYIVPGVGTNVLKVWEFDTRIRLGRFRPHHGFVFGSATASIAWLAHLHMASDLTDILITSFIFAAVLGLCNVLYDVKALDSGILRVYKQPWADGMDSRAIAMDYGPWFFGGFGLVYGAGVGVSERLAMLGKLDGMTFAWLFPLILVLAIALPVWGYRRRSYRVHGHSGCRPIERSQSI